MLYHCDKMFSTCPDIHGSMSFNIRIIASNDAIVRILISGSLLSRVSHAMNSMPGMTPLLHDACSQLQEYFSGRLNDFNVPLQPEGTPFQMAVWDALKGIPYGQCSSYGRIAASLNNPGAVRAVGMAAHNNPIPILIPCHRLIRSDGGTGGYAYGPDMKRILITLESRNNNQAAYM